MENLTGFAVIPVILGLVEVSKRAGLPSRLAPLMSLVLGVVFVLLTMGVSVVSILGGIVLGLSASGLYSGTKSLSGN